MNLYEQIGALEAGVEQLLRDASVGAPRAADETAETAETADAAHTPATPDTVDTPTATDNAEASAHLAGSQPEPADVEESTQSAPPTLTIGRPSQNEITMTIGDQTVSLHPLQVGQLIEELANARASMQPEPPAGIPPGWRFASTRNPAMAVQKQSNGDRLLILRHTGHGWVPFSFSPDMVVQMYMMLTQR